MSIGQNEGLPLNDAVPSDEPIDPHQREDYLGGRLALLRTANLSIAQRELYDYLVDTKLRQFTTAGITGQLEDGRLIGPFNPFLYSPSAGRAFNGWMDAQSSSTFLTPKASQVVILTVGAVWQSQYELYAHTAAARKAGLNESVVGALLAGREPVGVSEELLIAYRFTRELVSKRSVSDSTYDHALAAFTVVGVVDLVNLIGYYLATSAILNAFAVPAPISTENAS